MDSARLAHSLHGDIIAISTLYLASISSSSSANPFQRNSYTKLDLHFCGLIMFKPKF